MTADLLTLVERLGLFSFGPVVHLVVLFVRTLIAIYVSVELAPPCEYDDVISSVPQQKQRAAGYFSERLLMGCFVPFAPLPLLRG